MTLDTSDLQGAIRKIESDMRRLQSDVEQLKRVADTVATGDVPFSAGSLSEVGLTLPSDMVVRKPAEIAAYLREHPDLTEIVGEMAAALVEEFRGERSEIELVLYQDPEIDDRQLTIYVRVPEYDDSLMPRIDAVSERFDERLTHTSDLILITTDYHPVE